MTGLPSVDEIAVQYNIAEKTNKRIYLVSSTLDPFSVAASPIYNPHTDIIDCEANDSSMYWYVCMHQFDLASWMVPPTYSLRAL